MLIKVSYPKKAVVHQVLYVPKLACNLFSVRAAASSELSPDNMNKYKGVYHVLVVHAAA